MVWHGSCIQVGIRALTEEPFGEQKAVHLMLSQCANASCRKPFLKLREGKLFLVETDRLTKPGESVSPPFVRARQKQRLVEHFWLCDSCAALFTLVYDRERGVALAPLSRTAPPLPASTVATGAA
jgi:hypothetical protein